MEKQRTTLMSLKKITNQALDEIDKVDHYKNDYLTGYKKASKDLLEIIEKALLEHEKKIIVKTWNDALDLNSEFLLDITSGEQYYNLFYNNKDNDK
jgi:hypothetical protein